MAFSFAASWGPFGSLNTAAFIFATASRHLSIAAPNITVQPSAREWLPTMRAVYCTIVA